MRVCVCVWVYVWCTYKTVLLFANLREIIYIYIYIYI